MTPWLLSIVGVVVVGVLIDLLLTDSPVSKFVRSIYAFFILLVIVQPIPGFLRGGVQVGGGLEPDWGLVGQINSMSAASAQRNLERTFEVAGFSGILVTITPVRDSQTFRIHTVYINAWNSHHSNANLDHRTEIIRITRAVLNVNEDQIVYTD